MTRQMWSPHPFLAALVTEQMPRPKPRQGFRTEHLPSAQEAWVPVPAPLEKRTGTKPQVQKDLQGPATPVLIQKTRVWPDFLFQTLPDDSGGAGPKHKLREAQEFRHPKHIRTPDLSTPRVGSYPTAQKCRKIYA